MHPSNSTWDANTYLGNKVINSPFRYDPVVYFIKKPASCEVTGPITILISQDVDDCDDVAGWRGDDEVVMSEGDVRASDEIIIFVGPGKAVKLPNLLVGNSETTSHEIEGGVSDRSPGDIQSTSRQINDGFRFECCGKSEIVGGTVYYNTSPAPTGFTTSSTLLFDKISNGDIKDSKVITSPVITTSICPAGAFVPTTKAFCVLWENDWWVLDTKLVTNTCGDVGFDAHIQAKFASEFYMTDCGTVTSMWPANPSTRTTTGFTPTGVAKGTFILRRFN